MMITIQRAAEIAEINPGYFSHPSMPQWSSLPKMMEDGRLMIDSNELLEVLESRRQKWLSNIEVVGFAKWLIVEVGEQDFYGKFKKTKYDVRRSLATGRLSKSQIEDLYRLFGDKYLNKYELHDPLKPHYIPLERRRPLTKEWIKREYWHKQLTIDEMAQKLHVPAGWILSEIKRLGMDKNKNNIKHKGRKGQKQSESYAIVRRNQPHAKQVSKIDPRTGDIIKTYRSIASVGEDGYRREDVRRARKTAGLHKGYLWADVGMEQVIFRVAQKRGNLDTKLRVSNFTQPDKHWLQTMYLKHNMTLKEVGEMLGCNQTTVARFVNKYNLRKKDRLPALDKMKLQQLIESGLSHKEIAEITKRSVSTIGTYVCKWGISKARRKIA